MAAVERDPAQMNNIAADPEYHSLVNPLKQRLFDEIERTGDPAATGNGSIFDSYIYYGAEN